MIWGTLYHRIETALLGAVVDIMLLMQALRYLVLLVAIGGVLVFFQWWIALGVYGLILLIAIVQFVTSGQSGSSSTEDAKKHEEYRTGWIDGLRIPLRVVAMLAGMFISWQVVDWNTLKLKVQNIETASTQVVSKPVQNLSTPQSATVNSSTDGWQTIGHYQVKDSLVIDTQTGLMWMRCSLGQQWNGSSCVGQAKTYNWNDAMKQNNSSYAGYSDWRVPTKEELKGLVYCSSGQRKTDGDGRWYCDGSYERPTIVQAVFPNTPSFLFWSSSPVAANSYGAWSAHFGSGDGNWGSKNGDFYVRLAR